MALQVSARMAVAAAVACAAALLALAIALGVVGSNLSGEVRQMRLELENARKRVADLEQENDYLFEEREEAALSAKRSASIPLPDLCLSPPDPGPCSSRVTRWFFHSEEEDCRAFAWGGCRGNENNFLTISQCRAACNVSLSKPLPPRSSSLHSPPGRPPPPPPPVTPQDRSFDPSYCQMRPDSGPCQQRIPRFYHSGGTCLKFAYGGCSGNQNNFFTKEECATKCLNNHDTDTTVNSIIERVDFDQSVNLIQDNNNNEENYEGSRPPYCLLSPDQGRRCRDQGPNRAQQVRYHYDPDSGDCLQFEYSGCGGNENNFAKLNKCRKKCV